MIHFEKIGPDPPTRSGEGENGAEDENVRLLLYSRYVLGKESDTYFLSVRNYVVDPYTGLTGV